MSLTFAALRAATEVWFPVAGADKAAVTAMALGGAGEQQVPAAGAYGTRRTLWLLDRAAASRLPGRPRPARVALTRPARRPAGTSPHDAAPGTHEAPGAQHRGPRS